MAPFVKLKPVSTKFIPELRKRAASFRGAEIAARIQVPNDLVWWYWLEFGTAERQSADAPVRGPGGRYRIVNIDRGSAGTLETLHWEDNAGSHFPKVVLHPGIRPHPFVRTTIPQIIEFAKRDLMTALIGAGGMRAGNLKAQLMQNTMPRAIEMIGDTLATVAPGTRDDGKLDGNTAASVWLDEEDGAFVVDASAFSPGNPFTKAENAAKNPKPPQQKTTQPPQQKSLTWNQEAVRRIRATRLNTTKTGKLIRRTRGETVRA